VTYKQAVTSERHKHKRNMGQQGKDKERRNVLAMCSLFNDASVTHSIASDYWMDERI
jgi:hypothetical protein